MAQNDLTPQQLADLRLAGWHAAENGEADDLIQPHAWREGWHLRRFGVLPRESGRSETGPVATVRRLILASIGGAAARTSASLTAGA